MGDVISPGEEGVQAVDRVHGNVSEDNKCVCVCVMTKPNPYKQKKEKKHLLVLFQYVDIF